MLVCREIPFDREIFSKVTQGSATASFFQTGDWLSVWLRHFDKDNLLLGVFDESNLLGIAPLMVDGSIVGIIGTRAVAGGETLSDYGDVIAKNSFEEQVWQEIIVYLKREKMRIRVDLAEFSYVREDSPSYGILKKWVAKEVIETAPGMDLPATFEDYLTSLGSHSRHEIRRKMKNVGDEGVAVVEYAGEEELAEKMLALIALSSPEKKEFIKPEIAIFFRDLIKSLWPQKALRMLFLKYQSRVIAGVIFFQYKEEYLLYNSGFDPGYSFLSPGFVLKAELVKRAIESGIKKLDFLRGDERIKYDLGGKDNKLYKFVINL